MRQKRRYLYIVLLPIIAAVISLPWLIRKPAVQAELRNSLRYLLYEKANLALYFKELQIHWYPLGASVDHLTLSDLSGGFTVEAAGATITPNWLLILTGEIAVEELKLNRPNITINMEKLAEKEELNDSALDGASEAPFNPQLVAALNRRLMRLGLNKLELIDGNFTISHGKKRGLSIPHIDLVWMEDVPQNYLTRLRTSDIKGSFDGHSLEINEISMNATIRGFPVPEALNVQNLHIVGAHKESISLNGFLELENLKPARYQAKGKISASLTELKHYIPDLPPFNGLMSFEFVADSQKKKLISGELKVNDLAVVHRPFGDIFGEVSWDGGKMINVKDLWLSNMIGEVMVNADISLTENFPITTQVTIGSFSLAPLLEVVPIDFVPIILEASGKANMRGNLWPFKISGEADLMDDTILVYGDNFRDPKARLGFYTPPLKVKGSLTITYKDIEFHNIPVRHPKGGILWTSGGLSWWDFYFYMRIRGEKVDLSHLAALVDLPWSGKGDMAVVIEGPLSDPEVSATLQMKEAGVLGLKADKADIALQYKDLVISLPSVNAKLGQGSFEGTYITDMHPDDHFIMDTTVTLQDLPLEKLMPQLAANNILTLPFDLKGAVNGDFAIHGPFNRLTGSIDLKTQEAVIASLPLNEVTVKSDLLGDGISAELTAHKKNSALNLSGSYLYEEENGFLKITSKNLDLSIFKENGLDIDGTADIAGTLEVNHGLGSGSVAIAAEDVKALKIDFGSLKMPITLEGTKLKISAISSQIGLAAAGELELSGPANPWQLAVKFTDLPYTKMLELEDFFGETSGEAQLKGQLNHFNSVYGEIALKAFRLGMEKAEVALSAPVTVRLKGRSLELPRTAFKGQGLNAALGGTLSFDGNLSLAFSGEAEAAILSAMFEEITQAEGKFKVSGSVSGSLDAPLIMGSGSLKGASLTLALLNNEPIQNINGQFTMGPQGLFIDSLKGELGGGTLIGSGTYTLDEGQFVPNFQLALKNIIINPLPGLNAALGGQLALTAADSQKYKLSGTILFNELSYTKDVTLDALLPSFARRPTIISNLETEEEWLALEVNLSAPKNMIINNNLVNGEFAADLQLTGTNARMGLLGVVHPLSAVVKYHNNTFTINQATIEFTQKYRIYPRVSLQLETVACSDNVSLNIEWEADKEKLLTASGKTSEGRDVPNEEVLRCLQFGFKSSTYDEYATANSDNANAYLPGSLELLTSLTGLDEKAKEVIPLPIDSFRLTSGYSKRTARTAPWVALDFRLTSQLHMGLSASLDEVSDQRLEMEYSLTERSKVGLSWQSASDVPVGDFGLDLQLKLEFQ